MNELTLDRLMSQVELLERLGRQRVEEPWALDAIRDAAYEIERIAADDTAAEHARDIRIMIMRTPLVPGQRIWQTLVGERIAKLAEYCEALRERPTADSGGLRPAR